MRDVSLSAQKFDDDYADARPASARRSAAAFPPDFGPARHKERPALARFLRRPRLGVATLCAIAGLALVGVPMNALFLQDGHHPAPLFGAKSLTPEPIRTAEKAAPAPAPRAAQNEPKSEPAARAKTAKAEARSDAAALTAEILKSATPAPAVDKPAKKREAAVSRDPISALIGAEPAPAAMASAPAAARPAPGPDQNVLSAQRALLRLGYVVKPDGLTSPALSKAIEKFERDNALPPTGQLGPKVIKLLATRIAAQH